MIPSYNKVNDACFKEHHRYVGPDGPLENAIIRWYRQRWGRTASKKEISDWIGTGKSREDIEIGILGHKARIAGYTPGSSETITLLDGGWGDWMNTYAISPVPMSKAPGTDHAGIWFTFEWLVDFPVTGNYKIKGACDNRAKMYIDNKYVYTLGVYTGAQLEPPLNKQMVKGMHRNKVELYNIPIKEKILRVKGSSGSPDNNDINMWYQERWGRTASEKEISDWLGTCLLYTSPSPRDRG